MSDLFDILKPCPNPACGATRGFIYEDFEGMDFVHCSDCGMMGPNAEETFCGRGGQVNAARLWNALPRLEDFLVLRQALYRISQNEGHPDLDIWAQEALNKLP